MKKRVDFASSKYAQVSIFVIIALVLVAGIAGFFILKNKILTTNVPSDYAGVYNYYLSCAEKAGIDGASLLGTQAGYIDQPNFEPGSEFAPFSNQLDFFGFGIPYWYYVSGNGVIKEQVPTKSQMEKQLGDFISSKLKECDFTEFGREGFSVTAGEAVTDTTISDNEISINIKQPLILGKTGDEESTFVVSNHKTTIKSKIGSFYEVAKKIYNYEKENMFLENYSRDVLHLYAPVEGTEITCSPKIWNPYNVIADLKKALTVNIESIRIKGNYYKLGNNERKYFVVDPGFELENGQVNFMYSPDWVSRFEIWPTKNNLMIANPVGTEKGVSAMGFCYVSYKFVYDMYFPVVVQIQSSDGNEVFQFPVAVVVNKNQPRESVSSKETEIEKSVCDNSNTDISINTYNVNLEPVEADVKFKCFADVCELGKTKNEGADAVLNTKIPQCVNGLIIANAPGYKEKRYFVSTNEESTADLVLDREYNLSLEVYVDGKQVNNLAVLNIDEKSLDDNTTEPFTSVAYPYNTELKLAEGNYRFELKVYTSKEMTIPSSKQRQCVDVPKTGVLGIFGMTEENCFDYTIPEQKVSSLAYAGGMAEQYITPTELEGARVLRIYATSVSLPSNVDQLQKTYDLIEVKKINLEFV